MTTHSQPRTPRTRPSDAVTVRIAARPEHVYDLVADVTRMGEWSPECYRCEWLDGATTAAVGARFKARNKRRLLRWSNTPTVVVADRGREFAFSRTVFGGGEYVWRYRLDEAPDGRTDITESYDAVQPEARLMSWFAHLFTPGNEADYLRDAMTTTLQRVKTVAETESP